MSDVLESVGRVRAARAETKRVEAHLLRAERAARGRDAGHLEPLRRRVRELLLDELARYRRRGRFPINRDFAAKTPYFVDRDGTRCAMAHLLELGGERQLVQRIAGARNNAWVRELADEPRLLAWLDAAGLGVDEAAEIQPSYCTTASDCVCTYASAGPAAGVLEARVTRVSDQGVTNVSITAVHGDLPRYGVGDELGVHMVSEREGDVVLVPISRAALESDAGTTYYLGFGLAADGTFLCETAERGVPALTKDQFITAMRSDSCQTTLSDIHAGWSTTHCPGDEDPNEVHGERAPNDDGGCSIPTAGAGAPSTLGILTAILAALAVRRIDLSRARRGAARRVPSSTRRAP